jgi:hypothetical protein
METLIEEIVDKLHHLPEPAVRKVLNLVEFLTEHGGDSVQEVEEPLLSIAGILSGQPLTATEIDAEL